MQAEKTKYRDLYVPFTVETFESFEKCCFKMKLF